MNVLWVSLRKWLATSSRKQKLTAALLAFGLLSTLGLVFINGASGVLDDPLQSSPFYFIGVVAKLAVVLLLILACSSMFRSWFQPGSSARKTRQVQVIETVRLSQKQALHLVSIGGQQLLIGATDQSVSLITPVELSLNPVEMEADQPMVRTDFASLLRAFSPRSSAEVSRKGSL